MNHKQGVTDYQPTYRNVKKTLKFFERPKKCWNDFSRIFDVSISTLVSPSITNVGRRFRNIISVRWNEYFEVSWRIINSILWTVQIRFELRSEKRTLNWGKETIIYIIFVSFYLEAMTTNEWEKKTRQQSMKAKYSNQFVAFDSPNKCYQSIHSK